MYQGRSIVEASAAAEQIGAKLYVVSAGLGLVSANQSVPSYDCTVAVASPLGKRLTAEGAGPSDWWDQLTLGAPNPLSKLINRAPAFLALPASYLSLVREDLARVSGAAKSNLRIFTSSAGAAQVPKHLAACVLPYDERLESLSRFAGTQADFPQRALRHFVQDLSGHQLAPHAALNAVKKALEGQRRRRRPARQRLSDEQIREVLLSRWDQFAGSSARLLRYLRDDALISCEQKRFGRLWRALAAEIGA